MTYNSIQNIFSKNSAITFSCTMASGLIASRYLPITLKQGAMISGAAGALSSMGQSLVGKDAHTFKNVVIGIAALAVVWFATNRFVPLLDHDLVVPVLGFNALAQITGLILSKTVFASPLDSLLTLDQSTSGQIKKLNQQCEDNATMLEKLSPVMQQLVYRRFFDLDLSIGKLPATPAKEDVLRLTDAEVRVLYKHGVLFAEEGPAVQALLLRYFQLELAYCKDFERFIKDVELPIPETTLDVSEWNETALEWYKAYFTMNDSKRSQELSCSVQWTLFQRGCTNNYGFDSDYLGWAPSEQIKSIHLWFSNDYHAWTGQNIDCQKILVKRFRELGFPFGLPYHPKSPEDVQSLSPEELKFFNQSLHYEQYNDETIKAFHRRFYDACLPLANGFSKPFHDKINVCSKIEIDLPTTVEEVANIKNAQIPWVYFGYPYNSKKDELPIEVLWALNERFTSSQGHWYSVPLDKVTAENLQQASPQNVRQLFSQLMQKPLDWITLDRNLQQAILARLNTQVVLANIKPKELSEEDLQIYHTAFSENWHSWEGLWKNQQEAFNAAFDKVEGLTPLKVTSFRSA